ncbi:hypothetical protein niasHS_018060 [Heterodera schachtii]|uniref:Ubiquitin-like domain-containing protein n=1 Tax=Heterodera schachtii TaxID=97005 RepID=A0ABD2HVA3_HETSC
MNRFGFGISVGLTMLMLLMISSSIADDEFKIRLLVGNGDDGWTSGPTVMMNGEDTVADLKRKFAEEIKIEPKRQVLRQKSRFGPPLADSKTVKEYDFEKFTVLFLTLDEFKIKSYIYDFGGIDSTAGPTVMVKEEDTVASLKRMIAEEIKIEPKRQMPRLGGPFGPKLEESKTVKDYGIEKDQVISITFDEYKIFVHFNYKNYPIWVRKSDTIEILKEKTKRMLKMEFDLDLDDIELKSCDSPGDYDMFDQKCHTMKDYKIKENDVIFVYREYDYKTLVEFEIFVEYKQKKYPIRVKGADTVRDLKTKIGTVQEIGILPNQQNQLICQAEDGRVLVDDRLIAFSKIAKNSTVFLTLAEIEQQEKP